MGTNVQWFKDMILNEEDKVKATNNELGSKDRIKFWCKEHGEYTRRVSDVIALSSEEPRRGCPKCDKIKRDEDPDAFKFGDGTLKRKNRFTEEFINDLAHEEDKQKAREGTLKTADVVTFRCAKHGEYTQPLKRHFKVAQGEVILSCPACKRELAGKSAYPAPRKPKKERVKGEKSIRGRKIKEEKKESKIVLSPRGVKLHVIGDRLQVPWVDIQKETPDDIKELARKTKQEFDTFMRSLEVPFTSLSDFEHPSYVFEDKKIIVTYRDTLITNDESEFVNLERAYDKQGINFICVVDSDYFGEKKHRIEGVIKGFINPMKQVYARSTKVVNIPAKVAKVFCDHYHICRGTTQKYAYALVPKDYEGEITVDNYDDAYCVMSFSRKRFAQGEEDEGKFELKRYCVKTGITVPGGAKKLFNQFLADHGEGIKELICYSDCDYFTGGIYPRLGFTFVEHTALSYFWQKDLTHVRTRESVQVKKLKEEFPDVYELTEGYRVSKEHFICSTVGLYMVKRCGNKKWMWYPKNEEDN